MGFNSGNDRIIYAEITMLKHDAAPASVCHNVPRDLPDPCRPGVHVLILVSGDQLRRIRSYGKVETELRFLFRAPVYGQFIPQGVYSFLMLVIR